MVAPMIAIYKTEAFRQSFPFQLAAEGEHYPFFAQFGVLTIFRDKRTLRGFEALGSPKI
jgi:hypothetical protein